MYVIYSCIPSIYEPCIRMTPYFYVSTRDCCLLYVDYDNSLRISSLLNY